jgi:predicted porin
MGKYVWNVPGWGGGMYTKAAPTPATFTLYGGWLHIDLNNPSNPVSNGQSTLGGYIIGLADNFRYLTTSTQDWYWVGGKYATGPWTLTGAYYNQQRNAFLAGNGIENAAVNVGAGNFGTPTGVIVCNPATVTAAKQGAVLFAAPSSNCAGVFQSASFVIDYAFNKNVDIYTGVNYNQGTGVFINSAQNFTSQVTGTTGLRVRF